MLLLSQMSLDQLQSQIIAAAHGLRRPDGGPFILGTVEEQRLRGAALAALTVVVGVAVDTEINRLPPKFAG